MALVLGGVATAKRERPAKPLSALELQHKRMTEEGARSSRAIVSPGPTSTPNNGIVQVPIDTNVTYLESKGGIPQSSSTVPASRDGGSHPSPPPAPPCFYAPGMKTASLVKAFPEVTWHVCVTDMGHDQGPGKGLWVGPVDIKRTASGPWIRVLYQAGLADIFVPYHDNTLRFYDMQYTTWLDQVNVWDAGPNGSLIFLTNEHDSHGMPMPTVVAEVRDRGVAWLCKEHGNSVIRRGQEFVVWGVSDAGNYDNMIQISLRDDGSMGFRTGNTGFNADNTDDPSIPIPTKPSEPHAHNALWRVDMDLNGYAGDSAYWMTHSEPIGSLIATDSEVPFAGGGEGAQRWDYSQYASLMIEDTALNAFGHHLGYEFMPAGMGMTRHYGWEEIWTRNDVYVTVYHGNELGWLNNYVTPDHHLLTFINGESVSKRDLVVWIRSAAHHHPSDEDRSSDDLATLDPEGFTGVTLIHWSGFDIQPHNFFDDNPLGGPVKCGP